MARPGPALEHGGQRTGLDGDLGLSGPPRVDLVHCRREDDVGTLAGTHLEVGLEGAWIAVEILRGPELQRVDEDRGDDRAGAAPRASDPEQAGVTLVQRAHGGHKDDPSSPATPGPQVRHCLHAFHDFRSLDSKTAAPSTNKLAFTAAITAKLRMTTGHATSSANTRAQAAMCFVSKRWS